MKTVKTLRKSLACLFLFFCLTIGFSAAGIAWLGLQDTPIHADIAVVLGSEVLPNGTCSPQLAARLQTALEAYKNGLCKQVIVSGGVGVSGFDEAEVMARYLIRRGIPAENVIADASGVDTRATARFVAGYMQVHELQSVLAVSQFFHMPRTRLALKQEGVPVIGTLHAREFFLRDIYGLVREVAGYAAYWFRMK